MSSWGSFGDFGSPNFGAFGKSGGGRKSGSVQSSAVMTTALSAAAAGKTGGTLSLDSSGALKYTAAPTPSLTSLFTSGSLSKTATGTQTAVLTTPISALGPISGVSSSSGTASGISTPGTLTPSAAASVSIPSGATASPAGSGGGPSMNAPITGVASVTGTASASQLPTTGAASISAGVVGSGWTASIGYLKAENERQRIEDEMEAEEDEEAGEDEDDDSWGGLGWLGASAVAATALVAPVVAAPVGIAALLSHKAKTKRRRNKRKKLTKRLEKARAAGKTGVIARVQKHLAARKAKVLKVALRRAEHGKPLSKAEKRVLRQSQLRAAQAKGMRLQAPYAPPINRADLHRHAVALENMSNQPDAFVERTMDMSPAALRSTAAMETDVTAAEEAQGVVATAEAEEAGSGPLGLSWLAWAGITAGVLGGGYVISKGVKSKPGGGYRFDAKGIGSGIKADMKKLGAKTGGASSAQAA